MASEYRLVVRLARQTLRYKKRNLDHAASDLAKLLAERDAGKLSPMWQTAELYIEVREVTPWKRVDL